MSSFLFSKLLHSTVRPAHVTSVRLYSRWMHRRPAKVLLPFEPTSSSLKKEKIIELDKKVFEKTENIQEESKKLQTAKENNQTLQNTNNEISTEKAKEIKEKREKKINQLKLVLSQKKVFDENGEIIYEKCKENDGRIGSLLVKLKSKKDRMRSGMILVEGWRMIMDGLEAKCPLKYIIFSQTSDLNNLRLFLPKTGVKIYKIPYKEIQMWSDVETSPGIIGIFEKPQSDTIKRFQKPFPVNLVCDNIRVPGNLGALMRAAVGMGCDKVLLTKGCVDCWDPKVLRSGAGAHFRLPVHQSLDWNAIARQIGNESSVFIADSNNDDIETEYENMPALPYYSIDYSKYKSITLIIGGETEGISAESYEFASQRNGVRLHIPLQRGVDSLNTGMAAAVITFEVKRQLLRHYTQLKNEKIVIHSV